MRQRFFAAIIGLAFLGFIPGCFTTLPEESLAADAAKDGPCNVPEDPERLADQVLQLVNLERADADLPPVVRSPVLDKIADDYACRMIADGFFDHFDPATGYGPGDRAVAGEYSFFAVGENLAAGQETPGEVMKVWMESPAHRAIILDEKWSEIGLSVRLGGEYSIYWVQEFGAPADY